MKFSFRNWFYPGIILAVCVVLIWQNYLPGTYLTGWDTLHPEFNLKENLLRLFFGVWRSEQGLGAVAGHSHMADLPRVILLWFWSGFLPVSLLRYAYVFFCLILGPLGMYFLVRYLFNKVTQHDLLAALAGLVYLLNLATLQQFFVAFEMFPTQWAYLPWLMLFSVQFLKERRHSSLVLYCLFTFLASPQSYAAHLWYPFFGFYTLFLIIYAFLEKKALKLAGVLFTVTLLVNAFWLLPNLYFIFQKGYVARENLHNQLYSQEFLAQNRATGTLKDAALIKGFYFNWQVYDFQKGNNQNLMQVWNNHLKNTDVLLVGYILFISAVVGLFWAFKNKNKLLMALSPFYILSFVLLANRTPPFNLFFDFLIKFTLFEEALRFSFSKISILALFGQTLFMVYFLLILFRNLTKKTLSIISIVCVFGLVVYVYPVFQGHLISNKVKQNIPESYFNLWNYLEQKPNGRILTMPLNNSSGWVYYDWQYQGSGLIWFGLAQSVMDRDFDRWSQYNEQAYREFYNSLYTQNYTLFDQNLKKYRINYILRDLNQNPPSNKNQDQITLRRETNDFFRQLQLSGKIRQVSQFDKLILYELNTDYAPIQLGSIDRTVNPNYKWHLADWQYQGLDYLSAEANKTNYYPLRAVFQMQNKINGRDISYFEKNNQLFIDWLGTNIKLEQYLVFTAQDIKKIVPFEKELKLNERETLLFSSTQGTHGVALNTTGLNYSSAYLIAIKSKYLRGFPLRLCFSNLYTQNCQINDQLSENSQLAWDYFLVAGSRETAQYQLSLNALSYAGVDTASEVERILIMPLPVENLTRIAKNLRPSPSEQLYQPADLKTNWHNLQYLFSAKPGDRVIVLFQAFDPGWKAYLNGRELKKHVLVNNWANGWQLPESACSAGECEVKIVFWPQYLQFAGFGLLIFAFGWIVIRKKSS